MTSRLNWKIKLVITIIGAVSLVVAILYLVTYLFFASQLRKNDEKIAQINFGQAEENLEEIIKLGIRDANRYDMDMLAWNFGNGEYADDAGRTALNRKMILRFEEILAINPNLSSVAQMNGNGQTVISTVSKNRSGMTMIPEEFREILQKSTQSYPAFQWVPGDVLGDTEILCKAVHKLRLGAPASIRKPEEGEILKIDRVGRITTGSFTPQTSYAHWWRYRPYYGSFHLDDTDDRTLFRDLFDAAKAMGVSEDEVQALLENGCDPGEIEELLDIVGLSDTGKKKVKNFSMGMKQRLGIALALVGDPDLVILDEPINGLDPQGIAEVRDTLSRLNRERELTMIISSHILEELSKIATHYGIIHDGVLLQELTREELLERCSERIELKTDDTRRACTVLDEMGITGYKVVDADTIHIFERLNDSGEITMALAAHQIRTMGITVKNEALEDYYLNLTGGGVNA